MKSKLELNLRLCSGLFIAFFLVLHLLNAGLGVVSLSTMDVLGDILFDFWSIPVLTFLLYAAFAVHIGLTILALYRRRSLRLPIWNLLQIGLGLVLPLLLVSHVVDTRGSFQVLDIQKSYTHVVTYLWRDPGSIVRQYALVFIAWTHMCVGIHFWLRHKRRYSNWVPVLYPLSLFVPLLAGLGFARAGVESWQLPSASAALEKLDEAMNRVDPALRELLDGLNGWVLSVFALLLIALVVVRTMRDYLNHKRGGFTIAHTTSGKSLKGHRGQTVLEVLRDARVQHTSVCGGRGRCTTCRVRISESKDALLEPETLEASALRRVGAEPNVRLACQIRPQCDITITPIMHPEATTPAAHLPSGVVGHEQEVACMFVDLRGSTKLAEQKLPYDVVFILNQFFSQLADALRMTDGHYSSFNGDGLMALYGLNTDLKTGCCNALKGAIEIQRRMDTLNEWLAAELKTPLQVGIGIHCGEAIVGTMGPPDTPIISAIGDNINIAARLEALTKEYATGLVVSEAVLQTAGIDCSKLPRHTAQVRGRGNSVEIYVVDEPSSQLDLK